MLEIENLSVGNRLENISFKVPTGQLFGIVGPNGAGKSTLLKAVSGLIKRTGNVSCFNKNTTEMDRAALSRLIHLVPQGPAVPFDYTVRDIVSMASLAKADDALKEVDAFHLASKPITQISMGEKQRVYLARAIATECPILLFDEPTANLDIRQQLEVWELLQRLSKQNKTILVASHDLQFIKKCCSLVALIQNGQCTKWGDTQTTLTDLDIKQIFRIYSGLD